MYNIIWVCSTSADTQILRNYSPQSGGTVWTLIFWLQVPGMTLYHQLICPAGAWLQMAGVHNLLRLYALVICDHCPPPPPPPPSPGECHGQHFVSAVSHST